MYGTPLDDDVRAGWTDGLAVHGMGPAGRESVARRRNERRAIAPVLRRDGARSAARTWIFQRPRTGIRRVSGWSHRPAVFWRRHRAVLSARRGADAEISGVSRIG